MKYKIIQVLTLLSIFNLNIGAEIIYNTDVSNYALHSDKEKVTLKYNCGGYGDFIKDRKRVFEDHSIIKSGKCKHVINAYQQEERHLIEIKKDINRMSSIMENDN